MPEQRFYQNDLLNSGYVYTNLSKDIIEIVEDLSITGEVGQTMLRTVKTFK